MNYTDKSFEIDNSQIKFRNSTLIPYLIISTSIFPTYLMFSKGNFMIATCAIIGSFLGLFFIKLFIGLYLKNTIDLSKIDYVKAQIWDKSIDDNRDFWGTGRYKYHFPTGINKKTNPRVIFVHLKERKAAVGFVPENFDDAVYVLKERRIEIRQEI